MFSIYNEIEGRALNIGVTKFVSMEGECNKVNNELTRSIKETSQAASTK
jgi:hypothetical protein